MRTIARRLCLPALLAALMASNGPLFGVFVDAISARPAKAADPGPPTVISRSILSETCEDEQLNTGSHQMSCTSRGTKRFHQSDGQWYDFASAITTRVDNSNLDFRFFGKGFQLVPVVEQAGERTAVRDLDPFVQYDLKLNTSFQRVRTQAKWTSTIQKTDRYSFFGYRVVTDLPWRFEQMQESIPQTDGRMGSELSDIRLIVDEMIQVSFRDLMDAGYTISVDGDTLRIEGLRSGENVLDPVTTFYSTSDVDGEIYKSGVVPPDWVVTTNGTTSFTGFWAISGASENKTHSYLSFDTSTLSDSVTVSNATLSVYRDSSDRRRITTNNWNIQYYAGNNIIGAALDTSDYENGYFAADGTEDWGSGDTYTTGWKNHTVTDNAYINLTGDTDFEFRDGFDAGSNADYAYAYMRQTDYAGVASDPVLVIQWQYMWGSEFVVDTGSSISSMTASDYKTSMRFTAWKAMTVTQVHFYVNARATPPTYRFGLQANSSGNPSGTWLGAGAAGYCDSAPSGTAWQSCTLGATVTLTEGTIYHMVAQYVTGTIGASNYIALRVSGTSNLNQYPYDDTTDANATGLSYSTAGGWVDSTKNPLYMLYDGSVYQGNSVHSGTALAVYSTTNRAEKIAMFGGSKAVTTVGARVKKLGASCGNPAANLVYEIRDNSDDSLLDSGTIVAAGTVTTSYAWYDVALSAELELSMGTTYRVSFSSASSVVGCYYQILAETTANSAGPISLNFGGSGATYGTCSTTCGTAANWSYTTYYDADIRFTVTKEYLPQTAAWRWYGDEDVDTPVAPYADEVTKPNGIIGKAEPLKLRVTVPNMGGVNGSNIKFSIQYSTSSTFTDSGTVPIASGSCGATDPFCYYDGGNVADGDTIAARVLSDSDADGEQNEDSTCSGSFTHTSGTRPEFEFTIVAKAPTANTTYYFRPYDCNAAKPVSKQDGFEYPQITTAGGYNLIGLSPDSLTMPAYTLGGSGTSTSAWDSSSALTTEDFRGTGVGWSLTATSSHLRMVNTNTPDNTGASSQTTSSPRQRNMVRVSDGSLFAAYRDSANVVEFITSATEGASWSEGITGGTTTVGDSTSYPSMFIDSSDNIHLCYAKDYDIKYRLLTKSGSQWSLGSEEIVFDGARLTENGNNCSVVVESDGTKHVSMDIASITGGYNFTKQYMDSGGGWTGIRTGDIDDSSSSLTIDNSDNVTLIYTSDATGDLRSSRYEGSSYAAGVQVDATPASDYSLTTDTSNNVHIVYKDSGIKYRKYSSGSWGRETAVTSTAAHKNPSITTDSTHLWVFYSTGTLLSSAIMLAEYTGSAWYTSTYQVDYNSISSDYINSQSPYRASANRYYVMYTDETGDDLKTYGVIDYITAGQMTWTTGTLTGEYGAPIGSCPSSGVCAGSAGVLDPDTARTVMDADACTGGGCPADANYGMGIYSVIPSIVIDSLNGKRNGTFRGWLTLTTA